MSKFIKDTLAWFIFLFKVVLNGNLKNSLRKDCRGKTIAVLANGPSLKEELPKLRNHEEFRNVDFVVLNFFAFEEIFFKIKPKYYCFADPMFFQKNHKYTDVKRLYEVLDSQVNWDMNIYIPSKQYQNFLKLSQLQNKYLHIIKINNTHTPYKSREYDCLRHFFYRIGLSAPPFATVANLAIFTAINKGYSKIHLYGVDHTFFDSLSINENNQLCSKDVHFYDTANVVLKPILRNDNNEPWKISEYIQGIVYMFESHDLLANYSKSLQIEIINYTKNSLIDSYERNNK